MPKKNVSPRRGRLAVALILPAGLCALLMTSPAQAVGEKDGWYIGAGWGVWRIDNDNSLDAAFRTLGFNATSSVEKSNYLYRGFAGYQFAKWLAVEVGYANFSRLKFDGTVGGQEYSGVYKPEGAMASVILALPIHENIDRRVSLFLRGGAFRWDAKLDMQGTATALIDAVAVRKHDVDAHYGFGVHIRGKRHAALRLSLERFIEVHRVDLNALTLDIMYYY